MCVCVLTDLASWSPWPSCPSDPRPQLQTSVSRDGSISPASSGAAAWVRPAEDGLQAQGRRRRGDPERKTHDLMVGSWLQCCLKQLNHHLLVKCEHLSRLQMHFIRSRNSHKKQRKEMKCLILQHDVGNSRHGHITHTHPNDLSELLWNQLKTFYLKKGQQFN